MIRLGLVAIILLILAPSVFSRTREEIGAFYSLRQYECEVKADRFKKKVLERLVILNKRGDDHRWVGTTKPRYAQIRDLKAKVFDAAGKEVYERKGKDFRRIKGYGASFELYNDVKVYEVECSAPGYPYTIQLEYELEFNTLFFWRGAAVQTELPVDTFLYDLKIRTDLPYAVQADQLLPELSPRVDGDWTRRTWKVTDIAAFDPDSYVPGVHEPAKLKFVAGALKLSGHELSELTWDGIAAWYRGLAKGRYLPGTEVTPNGPLPAGAADSVRRVYHEVIDNSRYVAVSIGLSGWQPAAADETRTCGYGDCKGLSTLLISRLREAGISAYPALVLTRDYGRIDPAFPEFGFNHLIAVAIIDTDTLWMDPTCQSCPFGELPLMDENIPVLLITDTAGHIVRTPASRPEDNTVTSRSQLRALSNGETEIATTVMLTGNRAQVLRRIIPTLERAEAKQFYRRIIDSPLPLELVDFRHDNLDDLNQPLTISLVFRTERPLHEVDGCRFAGLPLLRDWYQRHMRDFDDALPAIEIGYPTLYVDSVAFVAEDSIGTVIELPEPVTAEATFAHASISSNSSNTAGTVVLTRRHDTYVIARDGYELLQTYYRALADMKRAAIAVCAAP